MALPGRTPGLIISILVLIFGLIHVGVGAAIISRDRAIRDIFIQPYGLAVFNIVIGIYGVVIGIIAIVSVIQENGVLSKSAAVACAILGVFGIASLVASLVLNGQNISFLRRRLSYRVNTYAQSQEAMNTVDAIQKKYQCCGVNLWLDWGRVALGAGSVVPTPTVAPPVGGGGLIGPSVSGGGVVAPSGGGGVVAPSGGGGVVAPSANGRRAVVRSDIKRDVGPFHELGILSAAVRRRRQLIGGGGSYYGLPPSYSINLPLSCCKGASVTNGQSTGGWCVSNGGNGTVNFFIEGCIGSVANIAVIQIMGIGIINVCITIVALVMVPIFIRMFPTDFDPNNQNSKQPFQNEMQNNQQQQTQMPIQMQVPTQYDNSGYYYNNGNYGNYNYSQTYATYQ